MARLSLSPEVWKVFPEVVELRRDFHRHPELGFQEERTARVVAEYLRSLSLEVRTGIAQTGVVGLLRGALPGPTILLRADMDALPLQEENETEYASQVPGVMHACGHDGHTALLLGVAKILAGQRERLRGQVKFVFQPAEEGGGGARRMIEEGVLEDPAVDCALALHLWNQMEVGRLGTRPGPFLAAADAFSLTLRGPGGHGAAPHLTRDPLVAAAYFIMAVQTLVSRSVPPTEPAVVSVGRIEGGTATNIIPAVVSLSGTVRSLKPEVRQMLEERLRRMAQEVAALFEVEASWEYRQGYPPTVNHAGLATLLQQVAQEIVGPERTQEMSPTMGAEDMAFFFQRVPGCYLCVGSANPAKGLNAPHHSPRFDFDEEAMALGMEWLVQAVHRLAAEEERWRGE